ncbi:aminopeptidase [Flavobacterium ammonificans]|uniref:Aminopeptidase n=1 Tax=Flavobacterium ammonificans TaxID=1751056 RepID=A0ABM7V2T7_9FLAO|nr:aminopeptidase [Flavobacterium ammonificans]BDB53451.1 hypothetical protein GENT11_17630 [Flavobacterium ammonificans]
MIVELVPTTHTLRIQQEITFINASNDTLSSIVLNDWNHAYSDKNTPLAQRFSDEFYRGFHLARDSERGGTSNLTILNFDKLFLSWNRTTENPDLITVDLRDKLMPNQSVTLYLTYFSKIPSNQFTKYGYASNGNLNLKNWYVTPARYENSAFVKYSNCNLDDSANGTVDFFIQFKIPKEAVLTTDLVVTNQIEDKAQINYHLEGKSRTDFNLFIESKSNFISYQNDKNEVITDINSTKLDTIQKILIINRIAHFVDEIIGAYPHPKILVTQTNYDRNPFYGLNQLPQFLNPFEDDFLFEIKFLKTYVETYLKSSLRLDPRKDNWIYDAIQMDLMIKYVEQFHPNTTMLGKASQFKLLKNYNLATLKFNQQYSYFYMLMARKNLDQSLSSSKTELIKFNEQIASKYRAGLSINFLDKYLQNGIVKKSIQEFYTLNKSKQTSSKDFESILKSNATKNINWFFSTIVHSRELIDYKFAKVSKTKDSITFSIKNKTDLPIPIPIYGVKKKEIVFKDWLDLKECDSTFTIKRNQADRIILNYNNEVPEINLRNNWKKLEGFFPNNRPIKFVFMKDLEDPYFNQILYIPTVTYNLYDGVSPGIRLHNKTILDKPITFDINPAFSSKTNNLIGSGALIMNENYRNSSLYTIRYALSGSYFHYAPNASYSKITPSVEFRIREADLRDNRKQSFMARQVMVNREQSEINSSDLTENYSIFNFRYSNSKTEVTHHFSSLTDVQFARNFGKIASEIEYRKLFENNRQINIRFYTGVFLFNTTNSDFFSFGLDRPTDYLFDYGFYGRSESSGFFSQQYIQSEGGFKSKLNQSFSNQWMSTLNGSFNIWNWIELYGDIGYLKNRHSKGQFLYDSGLRLNLVTDYFEVYFPLYSSNGFEPLQNSYNEKIRFVLTLSPATLINLFNRKWF